MSVASLRKEVLRCFKSLHNTRLKIFNGDKNALEQGRLKINEEFKKHKNVTDLSTIAELVQYSKAVEYELSTTVIQAKEIEPGLFEAHIRPETIKLDNVPFQENTKIN